jgi:hypothetical protein
MPLQGVSVLPPKADVRQPAQKSLLCANSGHAGGVGEPTSPGAVVGVTPLAAVRITVFGAPLGTKASPPNQPRKSSVGKLDKQSTGVMFIQGHPNLDRDFSIQSCGPQRALARLRADERSFLLT